MCMWPARWGFWEKSLSHMWHMYDLSPEWTRMWTFSVLGVLHFLSHTLHTCLILLLRFISPCVVWVHDALDFVFVDTTACMWDVWSFVFRTSVEDGAFGAAVLMFLPVISVRSAGTISASENTKEHQQNLLACFNTVSFNCTAGLGQLLNLISLGFYKWNIKLINFNFSNSVHIGVNLLLFCYFSFHCLINLLNNEVKDTTDMY